MPERLIMSAVRCRQAVTTSLACSGGRLAKEAVWSLEKQMTSQRPWPAAVVNPSTEGSGNAYGSRPGPARLGGLFSNHHDVVVGRWYLTGQPQRTGAQRTLIGRRLVGPVLPKGRDDDPLSGLAVEPQLRLVIGAAGQRTAIRYGCRTMAGQREEQLVPSVGELPRGGVRCTHS